MSQVDLMEQPVCTVLAVAKGLATPNYVKHLPDDRWLALPAKPEKMPSRVVQVPWRQLLMVDVSLADVASMKPGQEAVRADCETPWRVAALPDPKKARKAAVDHERVRNGDIILKRHCGALITYGLLGGLVLIGLAVTVYMLGGGVPSWNGEIPTGWWDQVHAYWWQSLAAGALAIIGGVWANAARRGWPAILTALAIGAIFGWPLYQHREWLLGPVIACGFASILLWRGLVTTFSRMRNNRLHQKYEDSRSRRAALRDHAPRGRTVTTAS